MSKTWLKNGGILGINFSALNFGQTLGRIFRAKSQNFTNFLFGQNFVQTTYKN